MPQLFPPSDEPRIGETNDLDLAHLDLSDMELLAALQKWGDPLGDPLWEEIQMVCLNNLGGFWGHTYYIL